MSEARGILRREFIKEKKEDLKLFFLVDIWEHAEGLLSFDSPDANLFLHSLWIRENKTKDLPVRGPDAEWF